MDNLLQQIQIINRSDTRQKGKIKHLLSDVIALSFFAMAANANNVCRNTNFWTRTQKTASAVNAAKKHQCPATTP
jgi:hypothetical protein